MALSATRKPTWLTFDCYGTLIQWDEGLRNTAAELMARKNSSADPGAIVPIYDQHEAELEKNAPFKLFRQVASTAFRSALTELGVDASEADGRALPAAIPHFSPFPEAIETLARLKSAGFRVAIISNTDDDLIDGNVGQLGGHIDHVVTAEQARSYKPSRLIFEHALERLGTGYEEMLHICAAPQLDHAAARDLGFGCVWIDRGTHRKPLSDYTPDETFPTLTEVPSLFARLGWMTDR